MIPGFNLDIKHKGKTFHIQTEDSGPANPVISTHIFIFGTILGTRRLEYGDALGRPDLSDHVRELMRAELKAMHQGLLSGEFDELAKRPQKKISGGEIPLARRTGAPAPVSGIPQSVPPPDLAAVDERAPIRLLPAQSSEDLDARATLDVEDLIEISDDFEVADDSQDVEVVEAEVVGAEVVEAEMIEADGPGTAEAEVAGSAEAAGAEPDELLSMELLSVNEDAAEFGLTAGQMQTARTSPSTPRLGPAATPVRAPRATVEFPTDLVAEVRFDDVILAWLLEDVDEP